MDLNFTEEQLAVKEAAREFAEFELLPGVIERDEKEIFPAEQVKKMGEKLIDKVLTDFLDELASDAPAPGGGAAACIAGAMGAALGSMVARLTIGKEEYADSLFSDMEHLKMQYRDLQFKKPRLESLADQNKFDRLMSLFPVIDDKMLDSLIEAHEVA